MDYKEHIVELALKPFYFSQAQFNEYEKHYHKVRWMTEEEQNEGSRKTIWTTICEESQISSGGENDEIWSRMFCIQCVR